LRKRVFHDGGAPIKPGDFNTAPRVAADLRSGEALSIGISGRAEFSLTGIHPPQAWATPRFA
jgi:hypothetical protein